MKRLGLLVVAVLNAFAVANCVTACRQQGLACEELAARASTEADRLLVRQACGRGGIRP